MTTDSAATFAVLHALRVKGIAAADSVRSASGVDAAPELLGDLAAQGVVSGHPLGGETVFALTDAGSQRHRDALAGALDDQRVARLAHLYDEAFLPLNVRFKALCATWQLQEQRTEMLEEAGEVHAELEAFLIPAAAEVPRYSRYRERMTLAMDAFRGGDRGALLGPVGDSYHNIWFELHEDLLLQLGRTRAQEGSA